jgi:hypothetical protein
MIPSLIVHQLRRPPQARAVLLTQSSWRVLSFFLLTAVDTPETFEMNTITNRGRVQPQSRLGSWQYYCTSLQCQDTLNTLSKWPYTESPTPPLDVSKQPGRHIILLATIKTKTVNSTGFA